MMNGIKSFDKNLIKIKDLSVIDDFLCLVCEEIPFNPYLCTKCNKNYCLDCIKNNKDVCVKCKIKTPLVEGSKFYKMFMKNYIINCQNKSCPQKDLNYETLKDHLTNCPYSIYTCACKKKIVLNQKVEHEAICDVVKKDCGYCGKIFSRKELKLHEKSCIDQPVECTYCSVSIKMRYKDSHLADCQDIPVSCDKCNMRMKKKELKNHNCNISKLDALDNRMTRFFEKIEEKINNIEFNILKNNLVLEHKINNVDENIVRLSNLVYGHFKVLMQEISNFNSSESKSKEKEASELNSKSDIILEKEKIISSSGRLCTALIISDEELESRLKQSKFLLLNYF